MKELHSGFRPKSSLQQDDVKIGFSALTELLSKKQKQKLLCLAVSKLLPKNKTAFWYQFQNCQQKAKLLFGTSFKTATKKQNCFLVAVLNLHSKNNFCFGIAVSGSLLGQKQKLLLPTKKQKQRLLKTAYQKANLLFGRQF